MLNPHLQKKIEELDLLKLPYALATVVRAKSPTAAKPGDRALITSNGDIHGWIGGGCAQGAVVKTACKVIQQNIPELIRINPDQKDEVDEGIVPFPSSCPSGGSLDIFIEPMFQRRQLWVFGSSPVAVKLAELAMCVDYEVKVAAPSADKALFPNVSHFQNNLVLEPGEHAPNSFIIVATQGKQDLAALEAALRIEPQFVGFVASAKKSVAYKQKLKARALDHDSIEAIHSPIGKEIGATTPAEIALSILATLTQIKHDLSTEAKASNVPSHASTTDSARSDDNVATIHDEQAVQSDSKAGGCCGT